MQRTLLLFKYFKFKMQSPILVLLPLLTVRQHLPIIEKENLETHKKNCQISFKIMWNCCVSNVISALQACEIGCLVMGQWDKIKTCETQYIVEFLLEQNKTKQNKNLNLTLFVEATLPLPNSSQVIISDNGANHSGIVKSILYKYTLFLFQGLRQHILTQASQG